MVIERSNLARLMVKYMVNTMVLVLWQYLKYWYQSTHFSSEENQIEEDKSHFCVNDRKWHKRTTRARGMIAQHGEK